MSSLKSKVLEISDESTRLFLNGCIDESTSILYNVSASILMQNLTNEVESEPGMLSFLMKMNDQPDDRYIKLPHYRSIRPRKLNENEMVLDEYGKYGILLNIVSNKKTFNFSVRLNDMTIVKYDYQLQKQTRGSFRNFALTDKYGNISKNWQTLKVFQMHETKKIFDNHDKHEILSFESFVGDQLGKKIFDIKYFLLKCYINRLVRERDYWKEVRDRAVKRQYNLDWEYEKRQADEIVKELEEKK